MTAGQSNTRQPRSETRWPVLGAMLFAACGSASTPESPAPLPVVTDGDQFDVAQGAVSPSRVIVNGAAAAGCDPSLAGLVGDTPLRQLTAEEYDSTARELFHLRAGVSPSQNHAFSSDGWAGSFPSNAEGSVTDFQITRYQEAAQQLAADATTPERLPSIVACLPDAGPECAETFIRDFGRRAFRRPLTPAQRAGLRGVYEAGSAGTTFADGIRLVIEAVLQSPNFLYHLELKPSSDKPVPVAPYEMAERLSYFIWKRPPDDALYFAAEAGMLETPEQVRTQALRLLNDDKARVGIASFTDHWLSIEKADDKQRDPLDAPGFGAAARRETERFVDHVLRDPHSDGTLQTLLTANFSFPEQPLWQAYGVMPPADYAGETPLPLPEGRAGVLTQASVLLQHSEERIRAPRRAVFILENLMCMPIKLPATVPEWATRATPGQSIRQTLEAATAHSQCAACHAKLNPLGFALDGFDPTGRRVDRDASGAPIDDASTIAIGDPSLDGPVQGAAALADRLSRSDSVRNCMLEQMHRFALGRLENARDTCAFVALAQRFERSGYDVRSLVLDIVTQDSFRFNQNR